MTVREDLYQTAFKANEAKKVEEDNKHFVWVRKYLISLCREAAANGKFEVAVKPVELQDKKQLTEADIKKFASQYDLDFRYDAEYTIPIISFETPQIKKDI